MYNWYCIDKVYTIPLFLCYYSMKRTSAQGKGSFAKKFYVSYLEKAKPRLFTAQP